MVCQQETLGDCLSHARQLRILHINRPLAQQSDEASVVPADVALGVAKACGSEIHQIGFNTRVWQVCRTLLPNLFCNLSFHSPLHRSPGKPMWGSTEHCFCTPSWNHTSIRRYLSNFLWLEHNHLVVCFYRYRTRSSEPMSQLHQALNTCITDRSQFIFRLGTLSAAL